MTHTMKQKAKRQSVLYVRIQKENMDWIKKTMKIYKYPVRTGKAQFVDDILTSARVKLASAE